MATKKSPGEVERPEREEAAPVATKTAEGVPAEELKEKEPKGLLDLVRRIALGTVGAGVWVQETTQKEIDDFLKSLQEFVNRLVEKGEIARKDGEKLIKEILERRRKKARRVADETQTGIEERIDASIGRILHGMNIPTKRDVEELSRKIADLDKKVESLLEERTATAGKP